jgi:hypothetical protein
MAVLLLWWADACGPGAHAVVHASTKPGGEGFQAGPYADVGVVWTSMDPVTTFVSSGPGDTVWDIWQHGVVITFPSTAFDWEAGAIFTFTPRAPMEMDPPLSATSYFFKLEGQFVGWGPVSLVTDIEIALQYDEGELGDAKESTLSMYHYNASAPGDKWSLQTGSLDPDGNTITCWTNKSGQPGSETGIFGVGGVQAQVFVPLIVNSTE